MSVPLKAQRAWEYRNIMIYLYFGVHEHRCIHLLPKAMKVACVLHSDAKIIFFFPYIENLQSEFSNGTQRRAPHETFYTARPVSSVHF